MPDHRFNTQQVSLVVEVCLQQEEMILSVTHKQVLSQPVSAPVRQTCHPLLAMEHSIQHQRNAAQALHADRPYVYAKVIEAYETAGSFLKPNSPYLTVKT